MKRVLAGIVAGFMFWVWIEGAAFASIYTDTQETQDSETEVDIWLQGNQVEIEWGERPTTGYDIEIAGDLYIEEGTLYFNYVRSSPPSGAVVLPVVTYPRDSKELPVEQESIEQVQGGEIAHEMEEGRILLYWIKHNAEDSDIFIRELDFREGVLTVKYELQYPSPQINKETFRETLSDERELPVDQSEVKEVRLKEIPGPQNKEDNL